MKIRLIIKTKREYYDMGDPMWMDDFKTYIVEVPKEYFLLANQLVGEIVGAEILKDDPIK